MDREEAKTQQKQGIKPEKKKKKESEEIRNCARWSKVCGSQRNQATEEKEIRLQSRPTSPVIQKEGSCASQGNQVAAQAAPPALPLPKPHLSCWVMSSSSLR